MNKLLRFCSLVLFFLSAGSSFGQGTSPLNNHTVIEKDVYDSLRQVLLQVDMLDQQYRNGMDQVRLRYGGGSEEMKHLIKQINTADSLNLVIVEEVIAKYGWLGVDHIGSQANTALFMVIQHSDLKTQQKYLPVLKAAVKNNKAKASDLALMEDRIAISEGKSQLYGSQLAWDLKTNKYTLLPIADPDNLDKRRRELGLVSYADYLKRFDIPWDLEQYKKALPDIESRFKSKK